MCPSVFSDTDDTSYEEVTEQQSDDEASNDESMTTEELLGLDDRPRISTEQLMRELDEEEEFDIDDSELDRDICDQELRPEVIIFNDSLIIPQAAIIHLIYLHDGFSDSDSTSIPIK